MPGGGNGGGGGGAAVHTVEAVKGKVLKMFRLGLGKWEWEFEDIFHLKIVGRSWSRNCRGFLRILDPAIKNDYFDDW